MSASVVGRSRGNEGGDLHHAESSVMDNINAADLRQLLVAAYGVAEAEIALIRTGGDGNQTFKVTTN